ncbi:MAG TPA: cytochrome c [Methylomirabilota bacterium]|nr:cytochrome c [Methylomirabilota bacterium]
MRALLVLLLAAATGLAAPPTAAVHAQGMRPPPAAATTPPFPLDDPQAIAEGARQFSATCTGYCHGREGRVSRAPRLRGKTYEPSYLYGRIAHGFPPMPAYQTVLQPEEIWKLVAYIMSLAGATDD